MLMNHLVAASSPSVLALQKADDHRRHALVGPGQHLKNQNATPAPLWMGVIPGQPPASSAAARGPRSYVSSLLSLSLEILIAPSRANVVLRVRAVEGLRRMYGYVL
jgi:hypothetical protein